MSCLVLEIFSFEVTTNEMSAMLDTFVIFNINGRFGDVTTGSNDIKVFV
jgi:hypothetical protein